jgi:gluconolactonase
LWGTLVYSDKLFVLTPEGDMKLPLDEGDAARVMALEEQFLRNEVTQEVLFATGRGIAPWMASVTFGGPDLRNVFIGSLKGSRIPIFDLRSRGCRWFTGTELASGSYLPV